MDKTSRLRFIVLVVTVCLVLSSIAMGHRRNKHFRACKTEERERSSSDSTILRFGCSLGPQLQNCMILAHLNKDILEKAGCCQMLANSCMKDKCLGLHEACPKHFKPCLMRDQELGDDDAEEHDADE